MFFHQRLSVRISAQRRTTNNPAADEGLESSTSAVKIPLLSNLVLILLAVLYGSFRAALRHGRIDYAAVFRTTNPSCPFTGCLAFSIFHV